MIKAVIFDLDHTLFDRHGTLKAIVPALRQRFKVNPAMSDEQIARFWIYGDDNYVYDGWKYIFAYLCENGVFTEEPEFADYRTFIFENFAKVAVKYDYSLPMLKQLKKDGYKVGLITNGGHALQYKKLKLTGLLYVFDEIIVSGDVLIDKPDKEIFLMMCEKLGVEPGECVYVGDNPKNDIGGAHNAGYKTIWVKSTGTWQTGAPDPDASVDFVYDVPEAVKAINIK